VSCILPLGLHPHVRINGSPGNIELFPGTLVVIAALESRGVRNELNPEFRRSLSACPAWDLNG
jgi:hypothetical protein